MEKTILLFPPTHKKTEDSCKKTRHQALFDCFNSKMDNN